MQVETERGKEGVLSREIAGTREEIVTLLKTACWYEIEPVMNYFTSFTNPDGARAQEIKESLEEAIQGELGHAR